MVLGGFTQRGMREMRKSGSPVKTLEKRRKN